jgi:hypothetical protein
MTSLKNLAAVEGGKEQDFLGYLCWYTIFELKISRTELEDKFIDAKVPLNYMPNHIAPVDAFRRATAKLEENRLPSQDKFVNYLVREVLCDRNSIVRQLIKETVDSKNVRLKYEKVGEIIYNRNSENLRTIDCSNGEIKDKLAKAEILYQEFLNNYDSQFIRRMVRTILGNMNPTAVRPSGGVYFVPGKYKEELFALERLVKLLGCEFFTMPVIDQENSRDMLYQKLREQIRCEVTKMADVLKGNASKAEITKIIDNSKKMFEQIKEYEELLDKNLSDLKSDVEVLKAQIISFLDAA